MRYGTGGYEDIEATSAMEFGLIDAGHYVSAYLQVSTGERIAGIGQNILGEPPPAPATHSVTEGFEHNIRLNYQACS